MSLALSALGVGGMSVKADASVEVSVGAGVGAAHGHNVKYPFTFLRCWYKLFRCAGTSLHIACETLLPRVEKTRFDKVIQCYLGGVSTADRILKF